MQIKTIQTQQPITETNQSSMKNRATIFNLEKSKKTKQLVLAICAFLLFSAAYSQSVTIIANGATPNGTDDAGDTIEYSVSVSNTGGEALNNVVLANSLGVTLTLNSGDTNNNGV